MIAQFLSSFSKRFETKLAVKTSIAAGLAWSVGLGFSHLMERPDSLISGLWCTVAAIVVIQNEIGGTYKAAWDRFVGVLIGSLLGGLLTSLMGSNPISLGISIFFTILFCSLIYIKDSIRIACLTAAVVMILWGMQPNISPWIFALYRTLDSILGILIAIGVAHTVWPFQATTQLRNNMSQILVLQTQLFRLVTKTTHDEKAAEEQYAAILKEMNTLLRIDLEFLDQAKMELIAQSSQVDNWILLQDNLKDLRNAIIDLSKAFPISYKILDPPLTSHLKHLMEQIDADLQTLSREILTDKTVEPFDDLQDSLDLLQKDRARFRNTHAIRKYELPDVENFFVFFYDIETIIDQVQKIRTLINSLKA